VAGICVVLLVHRVDLELDKDLLCGLWLMGFFLVFFV